MYEINEILKVSKTLKNNTDVHLQKGIYDKQNLLDFILYDKNLEFTKRLKDYYTKEKITRQAGIYRLKQNIMLSLKEGYYNRDELVTELKKLLNK